MTLNATDSGAKTITAFQTYGDATVEWIVLISRMKKAVQKVHFLGLHTITNPNVFQILVFS